MNFQKLNITDLHPADFKPRKDMTGDAKYRKIRRSIEEFGYVDPVFVNDDITVIGRHQRLKVLKHLDYKEIECVVVELNKDQEDKVNSGKFKSDEMVPLLKELLNLSNQYGSIG